MTTTHDELFERSVRESREWIDEVVAETGLDRERALDVLRAVLHAIRDEITVRRSGRLVAQMPALIRGLYFEGWEPNRGRPTDHDLARFTPSVARGVLRVIERRIPETAFRLREALPRELRALWPEPHAERAQERRARLELEAPMAPHQNRTPGEQHRGGPLPNTM
jgi:uncharacterized protein (DUF2267 family)